MTREEFSQHWEKKHATLLVPWALKYGVTYYAQVHSPILQSSLPDSSFNMEEWDGAAEIFSSASPEQMAEWREKDPCYMGYYQNVILADERRFLVSEALQHVKRVDPDTVTGKRVIIIQDGKALVDVGDDVMKVWNDWTNKSL